ncbi:MAG TPA: metallophosphoesterase family protein [Kofleriaceae bacterium]|nr:metallophosphoesterase family protein [Kofleriaceae bacterium]
MSQLPDANIIAIIDLLLTIGYVDGLLHADEKRFIDGYTSWLVDNFAQARAQIDGVHRALDAEIAGLVAEVTAAGDEHYLRTRLKVRAVALFRSLAPDHQEGALSLLAQLMRVDGSESPEERELYDELVAHFSAPTIEVPAQAPLSDGLRVEPPTPRRLAAMSHPMLDELEHRYGSEPAALQQQLATDYQLVFQAIGVWERQRARGNGRLIGITDVMQLPEGTQWLDGHTNVLRPERPTELVVLGDLHGCYSALKAALLQSDFIERVRRHQRDPANHPDVKLVLLGDYIDRGRFGFEGVLRAALKLLVTFPDHVYLIRGNHEFLVRLGEGVVSAVNPAEAVPALAQVAPVGLLEAYRHLFERMPTALLFERTLFVHGGIPRDATLAERYRDLSSLDDAVLKFEMMWSDPVRTDIVPPALQQQSPRFNFGAEQFRAFMHAIGCHTLIRGHEQVDAGFETVFSVGAHRLHTLFSAGGHDNNDLPETSRYRAVTPMALTIRDGVAMPWPIDYQPFLSPAHNGLYR